MDWWSKLKQSIGANDAYIGYFAILALISLILTIVFSCITARKIQPQSDRVFQSVMYYLLCVFYLLFVTVISLFPLLGMFGTVRALLELDLSGDLELIKQKFFDALTSTAWGILFATVFKLLNSVVQPFAEAQIEKIKGLLEHHEF